MEKMCYFIRHGYAVHNQLFWDIGTRAYTGFRDTNLCQEGFAQAKNLNKNWPEINNIELVCVSPCVRTLETALFVFQNHKVPLIAKDFLVEFPIGGSDICNQSKDVEDLKCLYPAFDFSQIKDDTLKWDGNDESNDSLNNRINEMLDWIGKRPEKNIAIVGHSSFIGMFKDGLIGDENNQLEHCYPYNIKINYDENGKFISK